MPKISEETKNEKRKNILQKSFVVFSNKGYSDTSIDDIVSEAEISKGGFYTYFKSKEDIFLAIAEERLNSRQELIRSFPKTMSCKDKLAKYIQWVLLWIEDEQNILQLKFTFEFWSTASRNKLMSTVSNKRYEIISLDLENLLLEGINNGEFKIDLDVKAFSYIILSSTDGAGFFTGVMGLKINKNIIDIYIKMILNEICKGV